MCIYVDTVYISIYIYIYTYVWICVCTYVYVYASWSRVGIERLTSGIHTVHCIGISLPERLDAGMFDVTHYRVRMSECLMSD